VAALVSPDLIHPHIDDDYVSHGPAKERDLFFKYLLFRFAF